MAVSITLAKQNDLHGPGRPAAKFTISWTSSSGGAANGQINSSGTNGQYFSGEVMRVVFVPGANVSNAYSVTLSDENSLDILSGQGANLSNTTTFEICPSVAMKDGTTTSTCFRTIDDLLTLSVTGAGNAKSGTIVIYMR